MYLMNVISDNQAKAEAIRDRINKAWSGAEAHTVMQRAGFEAMRTKLQQRGNIHLQIPIEPLP
jgi:hypothetical protein